jgi:hypothetical protein
VKIKKSYWLLVVIFLIGLILRLIYFKEITFGWDQARDAFQALNIWQGDPIKIIGPSTAELPGLHHGSFYWYLISPFYYFSNGNIFVIRIFLILLNLTNIFVIYFFSKLLFKNERMALLSSFFYAISFEAGQYGRWLSNPSPALLTIPLTFLGLWLIIRNKNTGVTVALISWALSVHFQFFLIYQIIFIIPILIWFYKKNNFKFNRENFIGFIGFFLILSPFFIAEIKFNFQGLKSFSQLSENNELLKSFIEIFSKFIDRIVYTFQLSLFSNLLLSGLLAILVIGLTIYFIVKKNESKKELTFLCLWLLSPIIIFFFDRAYAYFITIGNLIPALIITSYFIETYLSKLRYKKIILVSILILIFLGQITLILRENKTGESLFSVQKKMILNDELKIIDELYKENNGKMFAINTITNPLFINTTWAYLFNWYGKQKYGYMPIWAGYPQNGQFGSDTKFTENTNIKGLPFYVIIEPPPGIPDHYLSGIPRFENTRSKLLEKKEIGGFKLEKRILINNNNFDIETVMRVIKQVAP